MLHQFLDQNRTTLIERCRTKVSLRSSPQSTRKEMENGIPLFLGQLIETLRLEGLSDTQPGFPLPGAAAIRVRNVPQEMTTGAARHGRELLRKGYTVDQVVRDYGDLCQAVIELALDKGSPVSPDEFRTLNSCLDNAIADAVTEFGWQRDQLMNEMGNRAMSERLGFLAHELRNLLNTAMLSFAVIKGGSVGLAGATSAVLDRSLIGLRNLIDQALADVRLATGASPKQEVFDVGEFIAEARVAADLEAKSRACEFVVEPVEAALLIQADRQLLHSAVSNLLQNAFKFTRPHGHVSLGAYARGDRVRIDIRDQCGGLPEGMQETIFRSFSQHGADRSGMGLGLSISQRAVEACNGKLSVQDVPGAGCVFTIDLPRAPD